MFLSSLNYIAGSPEIFYKLTQNRAQRRAEKRQKDKKHKPPVSYPGQPAAAQMVERVDKAARRRQLLTELAALENG